jgi:tRNA-specific 2-thiouridylase
MKKTTAVAISGGVDSLMAACLLKEQGLDVIGIHFITGFENVSTRTQHLQACEPHNVLDIGKQLDIPVEIVDIRTEFQEKVVDYFIRTYQQGQTPNPCMHCNPSIKFGTILSYARSFGAHDLATGHYAKVKKDKHGNFHLFKGFDNRKDQSYFLARLTQEQLACACFPLGDMLKSDVKQMATQKGLQPVTRSESQDVCFIRDRFYGDFLTGQKGFVPKPGFIEDMNGQIIGKHHGLHRYTVGQRRGINCPAAEPYYVIRMDTMSNRLTVGAKKDLASTGCKVVDINWIGKSPREPISVFTRVRYRSREVAATVLPQDEFNAIVRFKDPQMAVTPGQGAVFYQGDEILGGGWIEQSQSMGELGIE